MKEILCPYCNYEFGDSWEIGNGEDIGLIECEKCGKSFYATRVIDITYSTNPATYGKCNSCGKANVIIENYSSSIGSYNRLCLECGESKRKEMIRDNFIIKGEGVHEN